MENKSRKVLIADDEPDILEILKYNLVGEGYEVITAKDGDEALEKARRTMPDPRRGRPFARRPTTRGGERS